MEEKNICKAAILETTQAQLTVEELVLPDILKLGQVLVRVHVAGICGAQLAEIAGAAGDDKHLPHLLGHEGAGIVEEIGLGVTRVKVGDQVVMHWRKAPGIEAAFPKYFRERDAAAVGGGKITTFNTHAVVSENRLTTIGRKEAFSIPFEIAALMGCAITTGLGIINNDAQLKIGESIAVIGCGGVGLVVIMGAMMVSANPICAFDIHEEKLKLARRFGATDTFNLQKEPFDLNYPDSGSVDVASAVDVVVETIGKVEMIEAAYKIVASGGRVILVGQPHHRQTLILKEMRQHFRGLTVMDSEGGQANPSMDIPRYANLYRAGKLKLDALVTHRYELEDVNEAITMARSGIAGRVILEML